MKGKFKFFLLFSGIPVTIFGVGYLTNLEVRVWSAAFPEVVAGLILFFGVVALIAARFATGDFHWPDDRAGCGSICRHKGAGNIDYHEKK